MLPADPPAIARKSPLIPNLQSGIWNQPVPVRAAGPQTLVNNAAPDCNILATGWM